MATYGVSKYGTAKYGVADGGPPVIGISGPFDPIYKLVIAGLDGIPIEEVPHNNLQYGYTLNDPGSLAWVMPIRHEKCTKALLDPGKREVHLYRNGVRVWGGYLDDADSADNENMRFAAHGFASRTQRWAIDTTKSYTNQDQIDIAWDLISWYQAKTNGSIGVTRGTAPSSGFVRTMKWLSYERVFIKSAIEEMALDDDGFDWEIDQFKKFNTFYKNRGTTRSDIIFEFGKNVTGLSVSIDATQMANNWTGLGSGEGASMCIAIATDGTAQATYGRLDGVVSLQELRSFGPLQRRTDGMLRQYKNPRWQPQLSLQLGTDAAYGTFGLGDSCRTIADYGYMTFDQSFRIIAMEFQISNEGREQCSVYLDVTPLA